MPDVAIPIIVSCRGLSIGRPSWASAVKLALFYHNRQQKAMLQV